MGLATSPETRRQILNFGSTSIAWGLMNDLARQSRSHRKLSILINPRRVERTDAHSVLTLNAIALY